MSVTKFENRIQVSKGSSSLTIYYLGATATSWIVDGIENLFLSSKAILDGTKAIRGGIPIVFPQFGSDSLSQLPQHGFARISKWNYGGIIRETQDQISVQFNLNPSCLKNKEWPHSEDFYLSAIFTLDALKRSLNMELIVKNTSQTVTWGFTSLLHTYFAVNDVTKVNIAGLEDCRFVDKIDSDIKVQSGNIQITKEVDRIYLDAGNPISFDKFSLQKGHSFPDVVVWNPWIEKAIKMGDFRDDEYKRMVCVEVGNVGIPTFLIPGQIWTSSQTLYIENK